MFGLIDRGELATADTAAVVATISAAHRAEAAAAATKLAAIAELLDRNLAGADALAVFDGFAATAAEAGAALGVSARRAAGQVHLAKALRHRLPQVADLLACGAICERVAAVISWRTHLVAPEAAGAIDAAVAAAAQAAGARGGWGRLSDSALEQVIDAAVAAHDPDAVRTAHHSARRRDVRFGKPDDHTGVTSFYGALHATDAALVERTIAELVATVCPEDPRSIGERRSDALGVLAARGDHLPCRCNRAQCRQRDPDGGGVVDCSRASSVVIHVLADQAAIEAAIDEAATQPSIGTPWLNAQRPPTWIFTPQAEWTDTHTPEQIAELIAAANPHPRGHSSSAPPRRHPHTAHCRPPKPASNPTPEPAPAPTSDTASNPAPPPASGPAVRPVRRRTPPTPPAPKPGGTAVVLGGSFVPGPLLAELVRTGAKITALPPPPTEAEQRYRPSTVLARFVRGRDMTCGFPGCTAPAQRCDIDHRIPWPVGPTHPGNTGLFCRTHHLAKTFGGWQVAQAADGTLTWTSPHHGTYRTVPDARILFPHWDTTTALPHPPPAPPATTAGRHLAMPRRRRTREAEQASRIKAEREANRITRLASDTKLEEVLGPRSGAITIRAPIPPEPEPEHDDDPPPF